MEYNHLVSAAGLVENNKGEILLVLSPDRGWEYPGGIIEQGETIQQGLLREIYEETGVLAEIISFVGISKNLDRNIVNLDFRCRYISGELRTSEESLLVRWVTPEQGRELVDFPVTVKRLENMLTMKGEISCFGFHKQPFTTLDDEHYPV